VLALLIGVVLFFAKFPAASVGGPSGTSAPAATAAASGVPRVTGLRLDAAIRTLQGAGFNARWDVASGQTGPACTVVTQDPAAGTAGARGSYVSLRYVPGQSCTSSQ
jgi:beta-lactam-binding protein with PASTA domain